MEYSSSLLTFVRTLEEKHHILFKQMENMSNPWKNIFYHKHNMLDSTRVLNFCFHMEENRHIL